MLFFIHNQLHLDPADIGLVYALKMFLAYKRKLELWMGAFKEMGYDKDTIGEILLTADIPKHWKKTENE